LIATIGTAHDEGFSSCERRTVTGMRGLAQTAGMRLGCGSQGSRAGAPDERNQQQKPGHQTMHSTFQRS
jgi:hypothetical protein